MTAYIAWLGLPSVVIAAGWCCVVAVVLRRQEVQSKRRAMTRKINSLFALVSALSAEWRQRRGVAE